MELQIFDEGQTWLVRPLERGHLFDNSFRAQRWPVRLVRCDDRTDIPVRDRRNRQVAQWVDEQITAERYLLCSIISAQMLHDAFFVPLWRADAARSRRATG